MKLFFFKSVFFYVCCIPKILVLRQYIDGYPTYAKYDREKKKRQKESVREKERDDEMRERER